MFKFVKPSQQQCLRNSSAEFERSIAGLISEVEKQVQGGRRHSLFFASFFCVGCCAAEWLNRYAELLQRQRLRVGFDQLGQVLQEGCRMGTVDNSVIGSQVDLHLRPHTE